MELENDESDDNVADESIQDSELVKNNTEMSTEAATLVGNEISNHEEEK
jgi:hypothetical protein